MGSILGVGTTTLFNINAYVNHEKVRISIHASCFYGVRHLILAELAGVAGLIILPIDAYHLISKVGYVWLQCWSVHTCTHTHIMVR